MPPRALAPHHPYSRQGAEQVYDYMEACIEALKQRIQELEAEKQSLRSHHSRTQVA
jgi:phage shock protein A